MTIRLTLADIQHDRIYTTGDVARLCGVDHSTVKEWVTAKKIDALPTLGRHLRFTGAAILAAFSVQTLEKPKPKPVARTGEQSLQAVLQLTRCRNSKDSAEVDSNVSRRRRRVAVA